MLKFKPGILAVILLVMPLWGPGAGASANTWASAGNEVVFSDSHLEAAIREAINKPDGAIYPAFRTFQFIP
jgi:hypothetical protein